MTTRLKFRAIPPGFADRFQDGDYTVGRGADPRGLVGSTSEVGAKRNAAPRKPKKAPRRTARTAAE